MPHQPKQQALSHCSTLGGSRHFSSFLHYVSLSSCHLAPLSAPRYWIRIIQTGDDFQSPLQSHSITLQTKQGEVVVASSFSPVFRNQGMCQRRHSTNGYQRAETVMNSSLLLMLAVVLGWLVPQCSTGCVSYLNLNVFVCFLLYFFCIFCEYQDCFIAPTWSFSSSPISYPKDHID